MHEFRELTLAIPQPQPPGQGRRAGIDRQTRLVFRCVQVWARYT